MEEKIPQHVARLITVEGFNQAVDERFGVHLTLMEAYESVERQYEHHYGGRKYSDYESFRQVRNRYIKSKKCNNVT